MPWHNGDYPPSYKNQPKKIREKATEIANEVLRTTGNEGEAIATGLKQARVHFAKEKEKKRLARKDNESESTIEVVLTLKKLELQHYFVI